MVDIVTKDVRSKMMSSIRSGNTKPEMTLRRALHKHGFRYRLHVRDLPGKPDLVFPRHKTALFVHGCFWHRHPGCRLATNPASNIEFWNAKFETNVARDRRSVSALMDASWKVGVVWECYLRETDPHVLIQQLDAFFRDCEINYCEWPN